ncbi:MAG: hypothetical protein ACR2IJ_10315, partial [Fluviibacter sp.]
MNFLRPSAPQRLTASHFPTAAYFIIAPKNSAKILGAFKKASPDKELTAFPHLKLIVRTHHFREAPAPTRHWRWLLH